MNCKDSIEKPLLNLLFKPITFNINNKVIRRGKLKFLNIKQFFIRFTLQQDNDTKIFEIPYPYNFIYTDSICTLDYSLSSFCKDNVELYYKLKAANLKKCSKLYDNQLYILTSTDSSI